MTWFLFLGAMTLVIGNAIYSVLKIREDLSAGRIHLAVFGMFAGLGVPLAIIAFVALVSSIRF